MPGGEQRPRRERSPILTELTGRCMTQKRNSEREGTIKGNESGLRMQRKRPGVEGLFRVVWKGLSKEGTFEERQEEVRGSA